MFEIKFIPSLVLVLMGTMDCLTTVIGTVYFGTVELNPLIAGLINTNLTAFVVLKLTITVAVGYVFVLAERTLMKSLNKSSRSFKLTQNFLKVAFSGLTLFLLVVVINNIFVIIKLLA
ncbi:MAG: DUF5658 family protein [Candidatus Bathyarchaeota archaeon]|nr:DUF5658 family protein [Candidatus Bathyarchaeota archaeon]